MLPEPAPFARQVPPYDPGMDRLLDLRLSANEGPVPEAFSASPFHGLPADALRRYPDGRALEARLADRAGIPRERVILTAGADDAIDRACRAYLAVGRSLVLPVPTFEMYARGARLVGAEVRGVPWEADAAFPLEELQARIDSSTGMIVVVTPDNPSGRPVPLEAIRDLARGAPHALVLVDAAYEEFAEAPVSHALADLANVLVVRTLSKAWSGAGLRIGFAIGHPEVLGWLRRVAPPYTVAGPSQWLASACLDHPGIASEYVARARAEREALRRLLAEVDVEAGPTQTNFVLGRTPRARELADGLAALGIQVRTWRNDPVLRDAVRISCPGTVEDYERLERGVRTVLQPQAILLDMDGVLANVEASYRVAIQRAAAEFGAEVTLEEIARAKRGQDVNNDWRLTQRLLADRSIHVGLDEVTEAFERAYQGHGGTPGLRERETPLCSADWLAGLAERLPLAVVTGRPRRDAERFLDRFGMRASVDVLVCMEDAPAKPDPAPVRLALDRLGVDHAWMVGDTPDDILAARGAGVLPVGVGEPGTLDDAGAWRTLPRVTDLDGLLEPQRPGVKP